MVSGEDKRQEVSHMHVTRMAKVGPANVTTLDTRSMKKWHDSLYVGPCCVRKLGNYLLDRINS